MYFNLYFTLCSHREMLPLVVNVYETRFGRIFRADFKHELKNHIITLSCRESSIVSNSGDGGLDPEWSGTVLWIDFEHGQ